MPEMVIIADDLSGAADCGIACAAAGHATLVVLGERADEPDCTVLAVDADTRGRSRSEAADETARLVRLHAPPGRVLFRKLDSTLRGHVAAELAATLAVRRETGPAVIVLAPAFPAAGRTTRGGIQHVNDVQLHETEIWRRERIPGTASLPEMLATAGLRTAVIGLEQVRSGRLHEAMLLAADPGAADQVDVLSCDAETEDDLYRIAAAGAGLGARTVWAGSAGLARFMPEFVLPPVTGNGWSSGFAPAEGPVLFVVGSLSAVSARQVAALTAQPDVEALVVAPAVLRAGADTTAWQQAGRDLDRAIATGRDVVISLAVEPDADPREGLVLCHALARLTAPHAKRIGALVSAGGETARAVLLAFGATGLRLLGEVETGVPLSLAEGSRPLLVVTKAGAFGTDDTFLRCRGALHDGRIPEPSNPE
ncbi:four-carbon acid sugar kinase family protein [Lichenicola sp.]|uniref:four-carbon acid sugar kinase family protein n=1 Tax=Lichenicola sp. TaxID=2804529 RepID=UPI003AFFBEF7